MWLFSCLECYVDAQKCLEHSRNVEPPVYNERCLNELPIPDIGNQSTNNSNDGFNDSIESNGLDEHTESSQIPLPIVTDEAMIIDMDNSQNMNDMDPLGDTLLQNDTNSNQNLSDSAEFDDDTANSVKTEYVPLFNVHCANNEAIDLVLDEPEEFFCNDDVVMIIGTSGMPLPMLTADNLIKRELDPMTGNIPFNSTVG